MSFRSYLTQLVAPTSLRRPTWAKYVGAIGDVADSVAQRARDSVKARFLASAPADAVAAIGGERLIPPGTPYAAGQSAETTASYRARLQAAWSTWQRGGAAYGLLLALADLGYPTAKAAIVGGRLYGLDGDRNLTIEALPSTGLGSWLLANDRSYWSRFDVVFWFGAFPDVPEAPSDWSAGLPAETSNEVLALKACIRRWKPAATTARIVIVTAGRCFGYPTGLTFGTLAANGYGFSGNAVTVWNVD
jgi:hypothetical protein